jgi:hypothetical protein
MVEPEWGPNIDVGNARRYILAGLLKKVNKQVGALIRSKRLMRTHCIFRMGLSGLQETQIL